MSPVDRIMANLTESEATALRGMADTIARELGESAEAWRGVDVINAFFGMVGQKIYVHDDSDAHRMVGTIAMVLGLLKQHPAMVAMNKQRSKRCESSDGA